MDRIWNTIRDEVIQAIRTEYASDIFVASRADNRAAGIYTYTRRPPDGVEEIHIPVYIHPQKFIEAAITAAAAELEIDKSDVRKVIEYILETHPQLLAKIIVPLAMGHGPLADIPHKKFQDAVWMLKHFAVKLGIINAKTFCR